MAAMPDCQVKPFGLAEFGRMLIALEEGELSALMAARKKCGTLMPMQRVNIYASLHITSQAAIVGD